MKIVYLSKATIPSNSASSVNVMKMCQAFSENGHEVILLAKGNKRLENNIEPFEYYGVDMCFEIKYLAWFKIPGYTLFYGIIAALKALIEIKPDLVYGRHLPGCLFSGLLRIKTIYESHDPNEYPAVIFKIFIKIMLHNNNFKRMIVLSQRLFNYYEQTYNVPLYFMKVAYNGADTLKKDDSLRLIEGVIRNTSNQRLQVGYIGHLYPGKGMEVISELVELCSWADFHVIGGTVEYVNKWSGLLADHDNCFFYGHMSQKRANHYSFLFDVLLLPPQKIVTVHGGIVEFKQYFSPPIKLFEYMQAGKAIIASDYLDEVLENEETALLCNPESINCWVESLKRLRDDNLLRNRLGKNASAAFIERYTWKARAQRVLDEII